MHYISGLLPVILAILFNIPHCELRLITGSITPTGGLGLKDRTYTIHIEIQVTENDPFESRFAPRVFIDMPRLFQDNTLRDISGEARYTRTSGSPSTIGLLGANVQQYSAVITRNYLTLERGVTVKFTINNIRYIETGKNKNMRAFVDFYNNEKSFIDRRVLIPFHPFSFIGYNSFSRAVITRFTSSLGYQTTAVIEFEYPRCIELESANTFDLCSNLIWLKFESTMSLSTQCRVTGQKLIMRDLRRNYQRSISETIRFAFIPRKYNGCHNNDQLKVTVFEREDARELENAVLFGFGKQIPEEAEIAAKEADYDAGDGSYSLNLGVTLSLLCTLVLFAL